MKIPLSIKKKLRPKIWITGLFSFSIPFALLFWGETKINPGLAGILNGTVPIWVFCLSLLFTPEVETITAKKVVGLLLGIFGVSSIFLPNILSEGFGSSLLGAVAVFLMAASYATGVLLNRTIFSEIKNLHPFTNLYQQLLSAFLSLLFIAFIFEGSPHPETWLPLSTVILSELYLGVISTSIAFMLFYQLIRSWGSVRAATVTYIIPALTLMFDLILNQHAPTLNELFGVLLVTCGVIILNLPSKKPLSP